MVPRLSGFLSCSSCGKLVVEPKANDVQLSREENPGLAVPAAMPDFHETMTGWRAWGIDPATPTGAAPVLRSVTYGDYFWTPRVPMEAECPKGKDHVPGEDCSCGLYSAKTRAHLQGMAYHRYDAKASGLFHVIGEVALWGKVIEGTQGWRAQFGYPRELFLPFEAWALAKPLTEAYGIPVRLNNILANEEVK